MAPNNSVVADVVCVASWNADLVSHIPRPLGRGETLMASGFAISPGGKGSNAAVAAARQGARVALIARIGQDDFGRMGLALWQAEGIDSRFVVQAEGESSGVAQILVYDDGDNSIAVCPGAGAGLSGQHSEAARPALLGCRVVMASCEVPLAATERAFQIAREAGALTLLNPAPARPLPDTLIALTDLLTPNESEVRLLAGMASDAPVQAAAEALLARVRAGEDFNNLARAASDAPDRSNGGQLGLRRGGGRERRIGHAHHSVGREVVQQVHGARCSSHAHAQQAQVLTGAALPQAWPPPPAATGSQGAAALLLLLGRLRRQRRLR